MKIDDLDNRMRGFETSADLVPVAKGYGSSASSLPRASNPE